MITNKNYNVDLASLSDKKLMYDFANKSTLIKLLKSSAIMASGISNIPFLSSDPNVLCNRLGLLLQEKQPGNTSDIFNYESVAIVDKLSEYKCKSKKQHKQLLIKCNLLHERV